MTSNLVRMSVPVEEYAKLKKDAEWLSCLEAAGVDNWEGYSYAQEIWRERHGDDD